MFFDDNSLILSLHEGQFETPLWSGFLERLLGRTQARGAFLLLSPSSGEAGVSFHAGEEVPSQLAMALRAGELRFGRVYAEADLVDLHAEFGCRVVRMASEGSLTGLLGCFGGKEIGAATGALLATLAPHMGAALRTYSALERERFRSEITGQAIARLQLGWMTLDARCTILEASENVEELLKWGNLLRRGRYDRLVPTERAIDAKLSALVRSYATEAEARPKAFTLSLDPWFNMLVTPAPRPRIGGGKEPAALVYVSGDRQSEADRRDQLVELFGLLPSEARLAWLLAQATSIAEAAEQLGLTIETARNYSKKIYAKTGARGHAELVRIVMTSVLAIS